MPAVWNRAIDAYKIDAFANRSLSVDLAVRLDLEPDDARRRHRVHLRFPSMVTQDFVKVGETSSTVEFARNWFESIMVLLQSEAPVFFTAFECGGISFAGLATDEEAKAFAIRTSSGEAHPPSADPSRLAWSVC